MMIVQFKENKGWLIYNNLKVVLQYIFTLFMKKYFEIDKLKKYMWIKHKFHVWTINLHVNK